MGTTTNVLAAIKAARATALKNKQAALTKASAPFDREIAAFDAVLKTLSGAAPKAVPANKAARRAIPSKKAATPAKKAVAPKKTPAKKAVPAKKVAVPKKATPKPLARPTTYPSKGTNQQKIIFVLAEAKRFLGMAEISAMIKKHDPSEVAATLKKRLTKHMGSFRKQGSIVSYQTGDSLYHGLPEYMEGGKPKKGFEHKV